MRLAKAASARRCSGEAFSSTIRTAFAGFAVRMDIPQRGSRFHDTYNRQAFQANAFKHSVINMPTEHGKIADLSDFGIGKARPDINISRPGFQVGTAHTGAILQACSHQR